MLELLEPTHLIAELTARHMDGREMLGFEDHQFSPDPCSAYNFE